MDRTELLTDEQKELEAARVAELESLRDQARKNELEKVRAEAQLEAMKGFAATHSNQTQNNVQAQPTEEQWLALEQQTGQTRQAIIANQQLTYQQVQGAEAKAEARAKALEERLAKAEARNNDFESRQNSESVTSKFFEEKPALKGHKKEVNEFLAMFPESSKKDPEQLGKILEKAEVYVRGVVGAKLKSQNSGNSGSARLGGGSVDFEEENEAKLDFTGLETKGEMRLIADIHQEVEGKESKKDLDKYASSDKLGIRYDSAEEFAWKPSFK